jgi:trehalose-phosphatase
VSGRALADLKRKVGLKGLIYVGNHGLEIEGAAWHHAVKGIGGYKKHLRSISSRLRRGLKGIDGALLEDKGLTLSVHYRRVKPKDILRFKRLVTDIARPYILEKAIKMNKGKKVFEIKPCLDWNKGKAVLWLLRRLGRGKRMWPVYVGDDTTDEDAFAALKGRGLTVVVGRRTGSKAGYFLKSQAEIVALLERLGALN